MSASGQSASIGARAWLLATEVRDATGRLKEVCPLDGGVELGERWLAALLREFREELGIEVTVTGPPLVLDRDGGPMLYPDWP
jgi:8-oxo-dGTP pyrophosphatase MutT (NUDIX family)